MNDKLELYRIKYIFASYDDANPKENIVYVGGLNPENAKGNFGTELQRVNKQFAMYFKFEIKEVVQVMCGLHKISLSPLELNVSAE